MTVCLRDCSYVVGECDTCHGIGPQRHQEERTVSPWQLKHGVMNQLVLRQPQTVQKLFRRKLHSWYMCMYTCICVCLPGRGVCVPWNCASKREKEEKKARVLKCHITQHGNYARDMQCVKPHHHPPLSMCRTGPQPRTCAQDMHETSVCGSSRVGNATLITSFYFFLFSLVFLLCWELPPPHPRLLLLLFSHLRSQHHHSWLAGSRASSWHQREWNPIPITPTPTHAQVRLPECFVSHNMVQGLKFSSYF